MTYSCYLLFSLNYSNIEGITGFNDEDSQSVFSFMRFAVELAKSDHGLVNYFPFPKLAVSLG